MSLSAIDPSLTMGLSAALEASINKALEYDPATAQALSALAPQVLGLQLRQPELTFYLIPTAEGIEIQNHYEGEVTAEIRGPLLELVFMAANGQINTRDTQIEIMGRSSFVADLHAILKRLDLDWEELLSQGLGDILGPQAAQLIRLRCGWLNDRRQNFQRLGSEFLTEELRSLASKPELEFFYQQVDELRFDTDRLAARFDGLRQKIKSASAATPEKKTE